MKTPRRPDSSRGPGRTPDRGHEQERGRPPGRKKPATIARTAHAKPGSAQKSAPPAGEALPEAERAQKLLARMGLGSRRQIETWIAAGRLTVEGRVLTLGESLRPGQAVFLDGAPLYTETRKLVRRAFVLNKPAGTVCTRRDPEQRPTVFELFPPALARQLICVGRLDFNTAGLLIFTTDGELAHRLMHPSHGVGREYAVRVFGQPDESVLERLCEGVMVDGEKLAFDEVTQQPGSGQNSWFTCRLHTGRNREVRRLWESQGFTVSRLIRVAFGPLALPRRLPAGRHAELLGDDLGRLYAAVGLEPPAPPPPTRPPGRPPGGARRSIDLTGRRR